MRARWTQRRAWTTLILASLIAWVAIGGLFSAILEGDLSQTAIDLESFNPAEIAPAAGPTSKPAN